MATGLFLLFINLKSQWNQAISPRSRSPMVRWASSFARGNIYTTQWAEMAGFCHRYMLEYALPPLCWTWEHMKSSVWIVQLSSPPKNASLHHPKTFYNSSWSTASLSWKQLADFQRTWKRRSIVWLAIWGFDRPIQTSMCSYWRTSLLRMKFSQRFTNTFAKVRSLQNQCSITRMGSSRTFQHWQRRRCALQTVWDCQKSWLWAFNWRNSIADRRRWTHIEKLWQERWRSTKLTSRSSTKSSKVQSNPTNCSKRKLNLKSGRKHKLLRTKRKRKIQRLQGEADLRLQPRGFGSLWGRRHRDKNNLHLQRRWDSFILIDEQGSRSKRQDGHVTCLKLLFWLFKLNLRPIS